MEFALSAIMAFTAVLSMWSLLAAVRSRKLHAQMRHAANLKLKESSALMCEARSLMDDADAICKGISPQTEVIRENFSDAYPNYQDCLMGLIVRSPGSVRNVIVVRIAHSYETVAIDVDAKDWLYVDDPIYPRVIAEMMRVSSSSLNFRKQKRGRV